MSQVFTILWIEDSESVIKTQEKRIRDFLSQQGFTLKLLTDNYGDKFEQYLDEEYVDIILLDYAISEEINGLEIAKKIREKNLVGDILFYSVHKIEECVYKELGYRGLIKVWDDKEIVEPLKKLINKNIRRYQDMFFRRGFVISKCIDLELKINYFLGAYFRIPKEKLIYFHDFVLENRYNSIVGKQKALAKILEEHDLKSDNRFKGMMTKLGDIINKRNILAHCKVAPDDISLISMGEPLSFNRGDINDLLKKIDIVSKQLNELIDLLIEN